MAHVGEEVGSFPKEALDLPGSLRHPRLEALVARLELLGGLVDSIDEFAELVAAERTQLADQL